MKPTPKGKWVVNYTTVAGYSRSGEHKNISADTADEAIAIAFKSYLREQQLRSWEITYQKWTAKEVR